MLVVNVVIRKLSWFLCFGERLISFPEGEGFSCLDAWESQPFVLVLGISFCSQSPQVIPSHRPHTHLH